MPPPSKVPAAPPDLVVQQQGPDVVLRFTYPSATEGGLPLTEIESISVLAYKRAAPELLLAPPPEGFPADEAMVEDVTDDEQPGEDPTTDAETLEEPGAEKLEEPGAEKVEVATDVEPPSQESAEIGEEPDGVVGDDEDEDLLTALLGDATEEELADQLPPLPRVDRNIFTSLAGQILEIDGAELGRYVDGNQVVLRLTDEKFRSDPWIHAYAVVVRGNGRNSAPSNIAVVNPVVPPPAVTTAEVEGSEEGVRIRWQLLDDDSITGYNVYRRSADEAIFGEAFGTTPPDQAWFVDTSAEMGARWVYAVTAVGPRDVESGWGNQKEIFYRDVYPPPAPTALVAIPDVEGVRLLWRHQPTSDHAGYVITRSRGAVTEALTETPVTGLEYTDRTATSGDEYVYHVVAIDEAGNSSVASEPVTVVAP